MKDATGGAEEVVLKNTRGLPASWSPDGRFILFVEGPEGAARADDLWLLPLEGERKPFRFAQTAQREFEGRFSPDGRWIAYSAGQLGRTEVYGSPFPAGSSRWQVSTGGGIDPMWRRDGGEIYYVSPDSMIMAAEVNGRGTTLQVGTTRAFFEVSRIVSNRYAYNVSPDGKRFLVNLRVDSPTAGVVLVVNWPGLLKN